MAFQPSIYRGTGLNLRLILASHAMQRELREPDPCITGITVNPVQSFALALMIDESCSRDETKLPTMLMNREFVRRKRKVNMQRNFLEN